MTNDRKDTEGAGFMKEDAGRQRGESPRRNQQGALGGSQSGRGPEELQGQRDQASGRRAEENLATSGETDVEDRKDRDIGSST